LPAQSDQQLLLHQQLHAGVGGNPDGSRGWQWVMVTPVVTVFLQSLNGSAVAAMELLGGAFAGIVVSDRFSA
jgi:transposase